VTVNSATAALHLTLLVNDVGDGDEVVVPAMTFVSTALAVSYVGATPIFADIDPVTLCMDWRDAENKANYWTRAIIPVDFGGYPYLHRKDHYDRLVIQDAAHNVGGVVYGDEVCFSFHPVKNLATGDGGCILTNSREKYERLKRLRWCGIDKSTYERTSKGYNWEYDIRELGYKYHWNDIQAAIGLVQLHRLKYLNSWRAELASIYLEELSGLDWIQLPAAHPDHKWHLFIIRVDASIRDDVIDRLREHGISAGVHYRPLTEYTIYRDQKTPPNAAREWKRIITLPLFFDMTEEDVRRVCDVLKEFMV
jgi:perosamine synthetase